MAGVVNLISALLQLIVPSYALRLVRRFGSQRVGWFIVIAFLSLALMHLIGPLKPAAAVPAAGIAQDVIYAVGSLLLLIGMGHTETMCKEREQTQQKEIALREQLETQARDETTHLARTNQDLLNEVARHREAEKALKESLDRYQFLFSENPHPMWILDLRSCRFLEVNQSALRMYGFNAEEFAALTGRELLLPRAAAEFLQDVSRPCPGVESRGVWRHVRKDGLLIDVEITALDMQYGAMSARLIVAEDVTARRRREEEESKAEKLEAIGRVTGGVAQHFTQIHALIHSHTAALLQNPQAAKSVEQLEQISAAVTRAMGLTRQLLAAGGQQLARLEPVDLNDMIRSSDQMLRRLTGKQITVATNCSSVIPFILADRRLVEHILINLVLNARDALLESGSITIKTSAVQVADSQNRNDGGPDRFVCLAVSDTGSGMTPEVQAQLFEPFFTTKKSANRMGLGLASVYGIVKQLSGCIECASQVGAGTEFRVFIPCAEMPSVPVPTETKAALPAIKGTVLLVESDDRTRSLARCTLNWNGYRVIEADSSSLALLLWDSQAANIDLLLTNLSFADGIAGRELADRLRQGKPGLGVVFISDGGDAGRPAMAGDTRCLAKPYAPEKLLEEVRGTLGHTA